MRYMVMGIVLIALGNSAVASVAQISLLKRKTLTNERYFAVQSEATLENLADVRNSDFETYILASNVPCNPAKKVCED